MQVTDLIGHPELLNQDTLYELRRVVAQCPYYQAARLLLVENLFLLHDPTFEAEVRATALYLPDREPLFRLVESLNYDMDDLGQTAEPTEPTTAPTGNRTLDIIGQFLHQTEPAAPHTPGRRRTIDPINDYMSVLETMADVEPSIDESPSDLSSNLLDNYLSQEHPTSRLQLPENPIGVPEEDEEQQSGTALKEEYFTETLAKAFIKQGNYGRAIEILTKINLDNPRKNAYFADQIRFLQKLDINARHAKSK